MYFSLINCSEDTENVIYMLVYFMYFCQRVTEWFVLEETSVVYLV